MASTFTVDDIRLLEKTISIRERIIDNLMKGDLPTKARDVDSITNLLESVDRSIFGKVKINLEETSNKVNEETKEILKDLLINLHKDNAVSAVSTTKEPPTFIAPEMEIMEGELMIKQDTGNFGDFT